MMDSKLKAKLQPWTVVFACLCLGASLYQNFRDEYRLAWGYK